MISTLIALPYEIARMPLVYIDSRLSDRLPETSGSARDPRPRHRLGRQARRFGAPQPRHR